MAVDTADRFPMRRPIGKPEMTRGRGICNPLVTGDADAILLRDDALQGIPGPRDAEQVRVVTGEAVELSMLAAASVRQRTGLHVDAALEFRFHLPETETGELGVVVMATETVQLLVGRAVPMRVSAIIRRVASGTRETSVVGAHESLAIDMEIFDEPSFRVPVGDGLHPMADQAGATLGLDLSWSHVVERPCLSCGEGRDSAEYKPQSLSASR